MITYEAVTFVCDVCHESQTVRHRTYTKELLQVRRKGWIVTRRESKCPLCKKIKTK